MQQIRYLQAGYFCMFLSSADIFKPLSDIFSAPISSNIFPSSSECILIHFRDKPLSSSEKLLHSDELLDVSNNWCDVRLDHNCGECTFLLEEQLCSLIFKDFSILLTFLVRAVIAFCCCKHICCVLRRCWRKP